MRGPDTAGGRFLAALARPDGHLDASAVGLIVAHPDDESVSCGGQLSRLDGLSVVLVTDGAPRNLLDANAYGFDTAAAYARARTAEFQAAMQLAGVQHLVRLEIPDQEAARELTLIARTLADLLRERRIHVAITHAFEGGHPDHDATAFAVHAAKRLLRQRRYILEIVEVPLYHLGEAGMVVQSFANPGLTAELRLALDREAQDAKRQLLNLYVTQRQTLSPFNTDSELFRPAPAYRFGARPNAGRILYEQYPWGLTANEWCELASESLHDLGLE
jgi:N-acetylglucosamine malate deacetylase 2